MKTTISKFTLVKKPLKKNYTNSMNLNNKFISNNRLHTTGNICPSNNNNNLSSSQFLKYKSLKTNLNKSSNNNRKEIYKSINTNNYIINTLNLSEKKIINSSVEPQSETVDLENNYNKIIKEKEKLKKQIEELHKQNNKLKESNININNKFNLIYEENIKLKNELNYLKDNQEQLVLLIKIIQKNGIDVENIIDKWNNDIENIDKNSENNENVISKDISNSNKSFTPITIEENSPKNILKVSGVPKLNFNNLNKDEKKRNKHKKNKSYEVMLSEEKNDHNQDFNNNNIINNIYDVDKNIKKKILSNSIKNNE